MRNIADLYSSDEVELPPQLLLPARASALSSSGTQISTKDVVVLGNDLIAAMISYYAATAGFRVLWLSEGDFDCGSADDVSEVLKSPETLANRVRAGLRLIRFLDQSRPLVKTSESGGRDNWSLALRLATFVERISNKSRRRAQIEKLGGPTVLLHYSPIRIFREFLAASRQEGAQVLNYVSNPRRISKAETASVAFVDSLTGANYSVHCGAVIDVRPDVGAKDSESSKPASVKVVENTIRVRAGGILAQLEAVQITSTLLSQYTQGGNIRTEMRREKLPGAWNFDAATNDFTERAVKNGVPSTVIKRAISTWGSRVRFLALFPNGLDLSGDSLLRGEIELAVRTELVTSVEDFQVRRLGEEGIDERVAADFAAVVASVP